MEFKKVFGTQETKPLSVDTIGSPGKVYVRKNIVRATRKYGEDTVEGWEYDEALMSYEEFAIYSQAASLSGETNTDETLANIDETLALILLNQIENQGGKS